MESSSDASYAVATEVGWYILGENQEHVGPYALSELQGDSFDVVCFFCCGLKSLGTADAKRTHIDQLNQRQFG